MTEAIFQSLIEGPLLIDDLPEAGQFARDSLSVPERFQALRLEQKLGHLYEDALEVLLRDSPRFEVLERGLQLQSDAHHTVGELDFLIHDLATRELIHLELAAKFYLAVERGGEFWLPGPDARDHYDRKLTRLREHQLTLTERFRSLLPARYREEAIITRQLIQGCLFDHFSATRQASPAFLNPHCRRGRWLSVTELGNALGSGVRLELIPKPLWPVPFKVLDAFPLEAWTPDPALNRCVMVRVEGEAVPYFVTPEAYPHSPAG